MNFGPGWRRIHLVGIGGAAMSAIARILVWSGHSVSGSDSSQSVVLEDLRSAGVSAYSPHRQDLVAGSDVVVYSAAVPADNPELVAARDAGIPVISRAQAQALLLTDFRTVAIAGTHGKTTTSAMAAAVLETAGLDPTYMVGADIAGRGSGARLGNGQFAVVEADEAYGAFLELRPAVAVLLNVDVDHLDYYGTFESLKVAFLEFISSSSERVVVCCDDPIAMSLASLLDPMTFGLDETADVRARNLELGSDGSSFDLTLRDEVVGVVRLFAPGIHKVQNALAAAAACWSLGVSPDDIASGLSTFPGLARRFERKNMFGGTHLIDDYAHLPAEVKATIAAAKLGSYKRVLAVFQPHLYSRTKEMFREFAEALALSDVAIVTDVFPAREPPIPGVSGKLIVEALCEFAPGRRVAYMPTLGDVAAFVTEVAEEGDLVLTMGAGDIATLPSLLQAFPAG